MKIYNNKTLAILVALMIIFSNFSTTLALSNKYKKLKSKLNTKKVSKNKTKLSKKNKTIKVLKLRNIKKASFKRTKSKSKFNFFDFLSFTSKIPMIPLVPFPVNMGNIGYNYANRYNDNYNNTPSPTRIFKEIKAVTLLALKKFSTITLSLVKTAKKVYNIVVEGTKIVYSSIKFVLYKVFNFTYYVLSYIWSFLLRNVRSIENSLYYVNAWLHKPVEMILMTVFRGVKWLGNKLIKGLTYLKNKIFKNKVHPIGTSKNTEKVASNAIEVVQEESVCTNDEVELALKEEN